ncbi:MAG TPA: hypothetical protein DEA55_03845 [Rhodospirillaceae bacterium]|nr:hypothetical protein [Rhodospirillaceae bacterium]
MSEEHNQIHVTTLPQVAGHKIVKDLGAIFVNVSSSLLHANQDSLFAALRKKASSLGANAVVGVSCQFNTSSINSDPLILGTAVQIEPETLDAPRA